MEVLMKLRKSNLKKEVLDILKYLINLSINNTQDKEDDFWINENGSSRRYIFKAFQHGEVQVFFKDVLILTYNQNCHISIPTNTHADSLNFLLA